LNPFRARHHVQHPPAQHGAAKHPGEGERPIVDERGDGVERQGHDEGEQSQVGREEQQRRRGERKRRGGDRRAADAGSGARAERQARDGGPGPDGRRTFSARAGRHPQCCRHCSHAAR